MKSAFLLDFSI